MKFQCSRCKSRFHQRADAERHIRDKHANRGGEVENYARPPEEPSAWEWYEYDRAGVDIGGNIEREQRSN